MTQTHGLSLLAPLLPSPTCCLLLSPSHQTHRGWAVIGWALLCWVVPPAWSPRHRGSTGGTLLQWWGSLIQGRSRLLPPCPSALGLGIFLRWSQRLGCSWLCCLLGVRGDGAERCLGTSRLLVFPVTHAHHGRGFCFFTQPTVCSALPAGRPRYGVRKASGAVSGSCLEPP